MTPGLPGPEPHQVAVLGASTTFGTPSEPRERGVLVHVQRLAMDRQAICGRTQVQPHQLAARGMAGDMDHVRAVGDDLDALRGSAS